jgi:uncharacterized protein (TIGR04255 family)
MWDARMQDQPGDLPEFENPPVIETVLGIQFAPIPGLTIAHFGWYWKDFLDHGWTRVAEAPPIPEQFERFGQKPAWNIPVPLLQFKLVKEAPVRLQIISDSEDRVIQLQIDRYLYNWKKQDASYPRFKAIYPEFMARLQGFRDWLGVARLGDISPNQWEVTYVNHIPKGDLWESPADWHSIFPGLYLPPDRHESIQLESLSGEWHYEITPQRGRLHISGHHGKNHESGEELLVLQLTSRGPIEPGEPTRDIESGLNLGHRVLVQAFVDLSSSAAHRHWGIK